MTATAIATFLLIALVKTPGEGGTVNLSFDTMAQCEAAGAAIEQKFEAITMDAKDDGTVPDGPKVYQTCIEMP